MKVKRLSNVAVGEAIILVQSLLLMALGMAAWGASDTIMGCLDVLRNGENMVAFATEDAIVTDTGTISTGAAQAVINNFEIVCLSVMSIGTVVAIASLVRLAKKGGFRRG